MAKKKIDKRAVKTGGLGLLGYLVGAGVTYALLAKKKASTTAPAVGTEAASGGIGATPKGFLPSMSLADIMGTLQRVGRDLGAYLSSASRLAGVPGWLIQAIVAHEIRYSKYTTVNPAVGATGPGQITPPTLFDTYYMATTWNLLSADMETFFKRKMGASFTQFRALAMQRKANPALVKKVLLDPEFNVAAAGLLLRCLTHLFNDGLIANQGRVVLGYNRGIDWSLKSVAAGMKTTTAKLIQAVAKPGWQLPRALALTSPESLQLQAPGSEARAYIADHLAPSGYFDAVVKLGLTPGTSM